MKASADQMARALDAPKPDCRFYLLYGPDEAGSAALAKRLERALGPEAERVDLDNAKLREDPALLSDEAASFSLFGGKRFIRIQPAGDEAAPAVEALLASSNAENPVVAIAGALKPSSALVKLALDHPHALACISYLPEGGKADQIAETLAREAGLRIDRATARAIAIASANDRAIMALEVEKLALFLDAAPDRPKEAGMTDYSAINADSSEAGLGALVQAVMDGKPDRASTEMARLAQEGLRDIPLLRAVAKRVLMLANMRAEVDGGARPAALVEAAGKTIFWKEKEAVTRQLSRWDSARLATAADRLLAAERAIKSGRSPGPVAVDQELIAISRAAERLR